MTRIPIKRATVVIIVLIASLAIRPHEVASASTLFADDFSSGAFSAWSGSSNLTIDPSTGGSAPPSARARAVSLPAWAFRVLGKTADQVCVGWNVNVATIGSPYVTLLRLRTATNGNIVRVFVNEAGRLRIRSDVTGQQIGTTVGIGTGWHRLDLCGLVGNPGTWSLARDGVPLVTDWSVNTGTTPVGRIEIGDPLRRTFTISFDDVIVVDTGPVPPPVRPNVLIFLTDDQRATDTITAAVMPRLRAWVQQAGTRFTNFFSTTPLCCPDRSVLLSGRYAHNTEVRVNADTSNLDHALSMERLLQQAGYRTAYVGKFLNGWQNATSPPYFSDRALVAGGYADRWFNIDGVARKVPYTTDFIGQQTVTYLDRFEEDDAQPWMLIAATTAPHHPWEPAAVHASDDVGTWAGNPATQESDRTDKPSWVRARNYTLSQADAVRAPQLRTLRSVDDMVDVVMTRLQALGELSNTLVIYTSDNGYLWSEHRIGGDYGVAAQKRYPYDASVRIPFLMRWDGRVAAGATDQRLAGMVDVVPTVLAAAGVTPDYPLDGYPLRADRLRTRIVLEYWIDPGDPSIPTWVSIRTQDLMYVEYYNASGEVTFREYYDLVNDPWELVNLLNDGVLSDPDTSYLQEQAIAGARCSGNSLMSPAPINPCP